MLTRLFSIQDSLPGADKLGEAIPNAAADALGQAQEQVAGLTGDYTILLLGLGLVVATLLIVFLIRRIIVNSVLGLIAFAIATYVFQVELPFIPAFVISVVFGLGGVGSLLILKFLGVM